MEDMINILKEVAPHVWYVTYNYQFIFSAAILFLFVLSLLLMRFLIQKVKKSRTDDDEEFWTTISIFSGLMNLFLLGFVLIDIVPRLINPTRFAIKSLIG